MHDSERVSTNLHYALVVARTGIDLDDKVANLRGFSLGEFGKDRLDQSGFLVGAFQTCPDSHDCLSSDVDNAALSCLGPSALSSGAIPMKVDI
ncbi:MAG: hypothetical protein NTX58_09505 [Actinobacteria bacterium]|nr:hypothetical protein [Actinomycetota bacterium]